MKVALTLNVEGEASQVGDLAAALSAALGGKTTAQQVEQKAPAEPAQQVEQKAPAEPAQRVEQKAPAEPAQQVEQVEQVAPGGVPDTVDLSGGVDVDGIPWDKRIHVGSKAKMKDGRWRLSPGLDRENLLPAVMAELKAIDWSAHTAPAQQVEQKAPAEPAQQSGETVSIAEFNAKVVNALSSGNIDRGEMLDVLKTLGCKDLGSVAAAAATDPTITRRVLEALGL